LGSKTQVESVATDIPHLVSKEICEEMSSLLVNGVSTEQSLQTSKEFPLSFEEQGFSLMPPKLDGFMSRRAREKGLFKIVSAREEALVKTQLKIMDIGPPLIDLYSRIAKVVENSPEAVKAGRAIKAALQQWGRAYAHVSKKRRDAVISVTDPRVDYLLKDVSVFTTGKKASELLFTGNFLELMLKEANQDETLAKRDLAVAAATRGRRNPFRSTRRGQSEPPARQPQFFEYQPVERGRGRGRRALLDHRGPRGRGGASRRYELSPLSLSVSSLCNAENVKVGARLRDFAKNWVMVLEDPWVLRTVSEGLVIYFSSRPTQQSRPYEVAMSVEMQTVCDSEVTSI
jgi:hypothetical protein